MEAFDPALCFGPDVAARYDDHLRGDEAAAAAFLSALAGGQRALELAIGTGRIALPLAARGVPVHGVDLSPPMVARLRRKPGGDRLPVTIGDFADVPVPGRFRLVYVVYNTLFNLLTQDEQVRCFENVAAHLTDDGAFVVEAFVPAYLHRLRDDQYVDAEAVGVDQVRLDVARHDPVTQRLHENHVTLTAGGIRLNPIVTRYAWPSELDLMARIAGLRLRDRWAGWEREPFTAASRAHVSVYGR
jgi:SAM-dependent methyltransferase